MSILLWIAIVYGILILMTIGIYLHDVHKYPVCPRCGSNSGRRIKGKIIFPKRIKGKIICPIHGEIAKS